MSELDQAVEVARRLEGEVHAFKVGLELFGGHGPEAVRRVGTFGPVFLDLKLHDIPTTVRRSARRLARLGVTIVTVHALGGARMVAAAVEGMAEASRTSSRPDPQVLAVTLLTSLTSEDLATVALPEAEEEVPRLATLAVGAGADGVVCAPRDLSLVREAVGAEPVVATPGIRPAGADRDDHAHPATPADALAAGADLLVVGRPITRAADPLTAARSIVAEALA